MKRQPIKFKEDVRLAYDGVNHREYKKGKSYTATHNHEQKLFEHYLATGKAERASDKEQDDTPMGKTSPPKQNKKKTTTAATTAKKDKT